MEVLHERAAALAWLAIPIVLSEPEPPLAAAHRLRHRGERGAVGYLGTWVDRPGLGYQARVDALDADFSLAGGLTLRGRAVTSRRLGGAIAGGDGHAAAFTAQFDDNGPFTWEIEGTRLSRDFEIDDFGYLPRANLMRVETEIGWRRQDYPDGGLLQGSNWKAEMSGTWDAAGKRLQPSVELGRGMDFRNGMQAYGWFWLQGSGCRGVLVRPLWTDATAPDLQRGCFRFLWLRGRQAAAAPMLAGMHGQPGFMVLVAEGKDLGSR